MCGRLLHSMYVCADVYRTQCTCVRPFTALNVRMCGRLPHSMCVCVGGRLLACKDVAVHSGADDTCQHAILYDIT